MDVVDLSFVKARKGGASVDDEVARGCRFDVSKCSRKIMFC